MVAVISFVCSVGNIPLGGGVGTADRPRLGGGIAFILADLIVIRSGTSIAKYYGLEDAASCSYFYVAMAPQA